MCWKAEYIVLIIASTFIDYYAGIQMEKAINISKKRKFLVLSLLSNLGLLFTFKYFNFFTESFSKILKNFNIFYDSPIFNLLLPVGISFYTFQTLSYSIDVYRGERKAEHHLGYFALYVSFFPQLVAGPIERSTRLLPQFFEKHDFNSQRVSDGIKLMMWGFFKKVVIADRLAVLVNQVYNNSENYEGIPLLLATYFFAFQIYCDFSGYSDIAIGAAKVLGFDLMKNFDRPYYSKSISEFWKRWHISLSTWFRDYLYIPLGGNRVLKWRWYTNLFLTFLISGLWHGANWTFVIWGAIHGFYLVFAILSKNIVQRIYNFLGLSKGTWQRKFIDVFITFHLVLFGWIFFRANSFNDATYILNKIIVINPFEFIKQVITLNFGVYLGLKKYEIFIALVSILILEAVQVFQRKNNMIEYLLKKPKYFRWSIYYFIIFFILMFGEFNLTEFIYFQF
jgi:D-alanyl-lipoteichoic acid acyltransferase DltB (MBOAT superfamily)